MTTWTGLARFPLRIAQLSDLHFGGPLSLPEEQMDAMLERVREVDPDVVVLAGDLTTAGYEWEYEEAARLALLAGFAAWADELLAMAEVEWDHEQYFHAKVRGHRLHRLLPAWPPTGPRGEIRVSFEAFQRELPQVSSGNIDVGSAAG